MSSVCIRPMEKEDEVYVGSCSHVHESSEIDSVCAQRLEWIESMKPKGLRVLVARLEDKPAGFLYLIPIEVSPWGPLGEELLVIPCLWVQKDCVGHGIGKAFLKEAELECRRQGLKGLVTTAYRSDFWFMPASYFERRGFTVVRRDGMREILWKPFDLSAQVPRFLAPQYRYAPVEHRVAVDLFWNTFCETSALEAERVREVVAEFGEAVVLREYCADSRTTLLRYQLPRAIYVNGREIDWGHEAPKEGIRKAIQEAMTAAPR